jgi:hypothetical protein
MKADGCDLVLLGAIIREPIGAMGEGKKLGWDVTFLRANPGTSCWPPWKAATSTRISSLRFAADQVLKERPSGHDHHQRAAGEERPLRRPRQPGHAALPGRAPVFCRNDLPHRCRRADVPMVLLRLGDCGAGIAAHAEARRPRPLWRLHRPLVQPATLDV